MQHYTGAMAKEVVMSREDTINDLKRLIRELEAKKREIDSQHNAVAVTIQLLNGDSSESVANTARQRPLAEPDAEGSNGEGEENVVPW